MRIIESAACIAEGCDFLRRVEPRFAPVLDSVGPLPLRRVPEGFAALRDIVIGQMVSTATARAIISRLDAAGMCDADDVRNAPPTVLVDCGLSRQKVRTLQAIAESDMNFNALRQAPDAEVERRLAAIAGIGPWTAQIYLLTALGRADAFAPGDLAKQEAARLLFDLPARPTPKAFADLALAWSPWRSVAARALWSYYRVRSKREGLA